MCKSVDITTTVYSCPVEGCDWEHVESPIDPRINASTLADVFGMGIMAQQAVNQRAAKVECVLQDHFKTHSVVDFVSTITLRDATIERLEKALPDPAMLRRIVDWLRTHFQNKQSKEWQVGLRRWAKAAEAVKKNGDAS